MTHAAITGWGKCLPPAILTNGDLTQLLATTDEWIISRTGIHERRISHVSLGEMAYVASERALAAAGIAGRELELIVFGTCSFDEQVPNMASGIQARIGAEGCAALDINTACTSFLYGLSTATAMIRTGMVRNALVIGAELISPFMDWSDRNVAVLFGDGAAAVVLQATDREEGVLAERLGCYGDAREILRIHGMGGRYANKGLAYGPTQWQFEGQEIFKRAVQGMSAASEFALGKLGKSADEVDLVVPHQANLRIIEAVAKRAAHSDGARVRQRATLRQHVGGHRAGGAVRSAGRRPRKAGRIAAASGLRRWIELLRTRRALGRARRAARAIGRRAAAQ